MARRAHSLLGMSRHCTKMKFSVKDFFGKCYQIRSLLRIWSHLLKKPLMENFIFCVTKGEISWFKGGMAGLKLIQNKRSIEF